MISYNTIDVEMPSLPAAATTAWLRRVAASHGKTIGEIAYIFCSDEEILRINQQYIGHDYYTDHIGFDRSARGILSGDVYIGLETVATNAVKFQRPFQEELHRVVAHGLLHLCGINDQTDAERAAMIAAEDEALRMLTQCGNADPSAAK